MNTVENNSEQNVNKDNLENKDGNNDSNYVYINGRRMHKNSLQALKPVQPGEVRNTTGRPKGSVSLSTRIKEMMNDPNFEFRAPNGEIIKGKPMDIIVSAAMFKASKGDMKAFDMLGKYGFGSKVDVTSSGKALPTPIMALEEKREVIELEAEHGVRRDDSNDQDKEVIEEN